MTMLNDEFFDVINDAFGYEYVPDPDNQHVVKTRDPISEFVKNQTLLEIVKTDFHTIYMFEGRGGHVLNVIEDDEFCYAWMD